MISKYLLIKKMSPLSDIKNGLFIIFLYIIRDHIKARFINQTACSSDQQRAISSSKSTLLKEYFITVEYVKKFISININMHYYQSILTIANSAINYNFKIPF